MEKIGNMQITDNKENKFFCFPMISMACTGSGYWIGERWKSFSFFLFDSSQLVGLQVSQVRHFVCGWIWFFFCYINSIIKIRINDLVLVCKGVYLNINIVGVVYLVKIGRSAFSLKVCGRFGFLNEVLIWTSVVGFAVIRASMQF